MPDGKICYIEIPATDVNASAAFYTEVFAWKVRARGDGQLAFDDTTGGVSGTWVKGRRASAQPGALIYIMVDSIEVALRKATSAGATVVTPLTSIGPSGDAFATFLDPAGNLFGLYQEPAK